MIENIWGVMESHVYNNGMQLHLVDDLRNEVDAVCNVNVQTRVQKMYDSIRGHLMQVVESKGAMTD